MKEATTSKAAAGVGLIAAVAASFCCITPVLALLAGASGAASSLSWLAPARPYLMGLSIAALGFAWYRSLTAKKGAACGPDGSCTVEKKGFWASRTFLVMVTVAAVALMAFPYYAQIFYPKPQKQNTVVVESIKSIMKDEPKTVTLKITGMTCAGCSNHIATTLKAIDGVLEQKVEYPGDIANVKYNPAKTSVADIIKAIEKMGYKASIVSGRSNEKQR